MLFCLIAVAILVNSWVAYPKVSTVEPATFTVKIVQMITSTANEANSTPETSPSTASHNIPVDIVINSDDVSKKMPDCANVSEIETLERQILYMSPTTSAFWMQQNLGRDLHIGDLSPPIRAFEAAVCNMSTWGHAGIVQDGYLNIQEAKHAGHLNQVCFGEYNPKITADTLLALDGFLHCPTGSGIKANTVHMEANHEVPPEVNKMTIWWITKWLTSEYRANQMVMLAKAESGYRNLALGSSCDTGVLQLVRHQDIAYDLGYYWPEDDGSGCGGGQVHDMYDAAYNTVVSVHLATGQKVFTGPWTTARLYGFRD